MEPLPEHEYSKEAISNLIKDLTEELGMEYESFGLTTWRREKSLIGAEPDNCFYFQNALLVRGKVTMYLSTDTSRDNHLPESRGFIHGFLL